MCKSFSRNISWIRFHVIFCIFQDRTLDAHGSNSSGNQSLRVTHEPRTSYGRPSVIYSYFSLFSKLLISRIFFRSRGAAGIRGLGAPGTPPPKNLVRHLHRFAVPDQEMVYPDKFCGKMINSEYPYHTHGMNAAHGMIPHGPPTSPPPIGNGNGAGGFHFNPNMRMMPPTVPHPQNMAAAAGVPLFPLYYHWLNNTF